MRTKVCRKPLQIISQVGILILSSMILFTALSGSLNQNTTGEIDKLINTYGDSLLDISLHKSFMNASGTDGNDPNNPSGEVNQEIIHLFDVYESDDRIDFITYLKPFDDIKIGFNNQKFTIQSTGNTPVIGSLIAGEMPSSQNPGVAVPHTLAQQLGITNEELLGQEIDFSAVIGNWDTGSYEFHNAQTKAKVVAVLDTTIYFEYEDSLIDVELTDSFIFSPDLLEGLLDQAKTNIGSSSSVNIRPKSPEDMISIKDELMKQGIVPLGQFELVEDYVRLGSQTQSQTEGANIILVMIALLIIGSGGFMLINTQKKDIQVYLLQGFSKLQVMSMFILELLFVSVMSLILMMVFLSPISALLQSLLATELNTSIALYIALASILMVLVLVSSLAITKDSNRKENVQHD